VCAKPAGAAGLGYLLFPVRRFAPPMEQPRMRGADGSFGQAIDLFDI